METAITGVAFMEGSSHGGISSSDPSDDTFAVDVWARGKVTGNGVVIERDDVESLWMMRQMVDDGERSLYLAMKLSHWSTTIGFGLFGERGEMGCDVGAERRVVYAGGPRG